jgi:hypothetical protein
VGAGHGSCRRPRRAGLIAGWKILVFANSSSGVHHQLNRTPEEAIKRVSRDHLAGLGYRRTMTKSAHYRTGQIVARGTSADFCALAITEMPPPRILGDRGEDDRWTSLTRFAHASDLHITDTESPARLDFICDVTDDPRCEQPLPTLRPQQLTSTHAAAATLRTIGRMASTGRLDCAVLSGDLIDNAQANELDRLLAMIGGGTVAPSAVPGSLQGAQSAQWTDTKVWQPRSENHWTVN